MNFDSGFERPACLATLKSSDRTKQSVCGWLYIYMCVCVCVCVYLREPFKNLLTWLKKKSHGLTSVTSILRMSKFVRSYIYQSVHIYVNHLIYVHLFICLSLSIYLSIYISPSSSWSSTDCSNSIDSFSSSVPIVNSSFFVS